MSVIKLLSIGVCLYAGISGNLGTAPMWPVWMLIAGIFVTLILGVEGKCSIYCTEYGWNQRKRIANIRLAKL